MTALQLRLAALALLTVFPFTSNAGQDGGSETLEVIEIEGNDPRALRSDFVAKRKDFYQAYNELVDDRDFRIECNQSDERIATRLSKKECLPAFVSRIHLQEWGKFKRGMGPLNYKRMDRLILEKKDIMNETFNNLLRTHPELLAKYQTMTQARDKYRDAKGEDPVNPLD